MLVEIYCVFGDRNLAQILCVTCDNASNNKIMIDKLENKITAFSGKASHVHSFLHIINLVVKTLTQEFDVKKKTDQTGLFKAAETCKEVLEMELDKLADGTNVEDSVTLALDRVNQRVEDDEEDGEEDNEEGWVNEVGLLMDEKCSEFEGDILPVKLAIIKVC